MYSNANTTADFTNNTSPAIEFLGLLDPDKNNTFQTFDDKGERRKPSPIRVLHGSISDHVETLANLNSEGAGIFVTVNKTNGQGRKKENIIRVRAVFGEFDEGVPSDLPLEPSIIVETSPGKFHHYWLADGLSLNDFAVAIPHK